MGSATLSGVMPATLLDVSGLTRRGDDGRLLLDGIDLTLRVGDRVTVSGPSGAGKSQLLRALAQLDPVQGGEVLWRGREVPDTEVPRFRSRVIYHQQHTALVDGTIGSNLELPFELGVHEELSFDRARAAELLARFERPALQLSSDTMDLSGGERQIVALVRVLLLDPEVLLLDEPTAALDPASEAGVVETMDEWMNAGDRALIWVTHDDRLTDRVGNRALVLDAGQVREEG